MANATARLSLLLACALAGTRPRACAPPPSGSHARAPAGPKLIPHPSAPLAASAAPPRATRAVLSEEAASPALEFGVRILGSNAEEFGAAEKAELCASFVAIADLDDPGTLTRAPRRRG